MDGSDITNESSSQDRPSTPTSKISRIPVPSSRSNSPVPSRSASANALAADVTPTKDAQKRAQMEDAVGDLAATTASITNSKYSLAASRRSNSAKSLSGAASSAVNASLVSGGKSRTSLTPSRKSASSASLQQQQQSTPPRRSSSVRPAIQTVSAGSGTDGFQVATAGAEQSSKPNSAATASTPNRRSSVQSQSSLASPSSIWSVDNEPPLRENDRGRVKVFVRLRPRNEVEAASGEQASVTVSPDAKCIGVLDAKKDLNYSFDHVFTDNATHKEIFNVIGKPVVNSALKGFNGTLMAYGQTGTGKTHTLTSNDGLIPQLVYFLFRRVALDDFYDYKVTCSCIQIYNERIYDLLVEDGGVKMNSTAMDGELNLRENQESGVFVEGLKEFVVRSPKEVFELVKIARSRLVFAETKMNRASSRSHAITFLNIERTSNKNRPSTAGSSSKLPEQVKPAEKFAGFEGDDDDEDTDIQADGEDEEENTPIEGELNDYVLKGRITICDLAGSERIKKTLATGERLSEAQQINLSLLELGNVIHALTDPKRSHVPFRNSTLTRLLTESLGGNCLTRLIVCIGPCVKDLSETKGTLLFGTRAMRVKNNARVNIEVDYKTYSEKLEQQLAQHAEQWKIREKELLSQVDELVREQLKEMSLEKASLAEQLGVLRGQLDEAEGRAKLADSKRDSYAAIFAQLSTWMSVKDASIWTSIHCALYNVEQSVNCPELNSDHVASAKAHIEKVKRSMAFIPKALGLLVEWLDEINNANTSSDVMEKWLAAFPSLEAALNGNLIHHIKALEAGDGDTRELALILKSLLQGSTVTDIPAANSSAIHHLLSGVQLASPLHFVAAIPLLLQYQTADRLLFCTRAILAGMKTADTREKTSNESISTETQTRPELPKKTVEADVQTEAVAKPEVDIDEVARDRRAAKKSEFCSIGGAKCCIQ